MAAAAMSLSLALVDLSAQGQLPVPIPGRNVNMVSGTNFPDGDPFLQRQNEPSIAVSTRNPLHVLGAANDYRTVDIPGLGDEVVGDAWLGIFKSFDGGATWKSTLLPGFRQDQTTVGQNSPLYGLEAAADPVMRAGTNGLFYLAGMAFNRDQDSGKVFVARYIDNNNQEAGDTIAYLGTSVVDVGSETRFLDKPWIAVDIPRAMKGRGRSDDDDRNERGRYRDKQDRGWDRDRDRRSPQHPNQSRRPPSGPMCNVPGQAQPIPAGTIYVMYSVFIDPPAAQRGREEEEERGRGRNTDRDRRRERDDEPDGGFERRKRRERENAEDHQPGKSMEGRTQIMLSRSTDCGATFTRPMKISERTQINQGSTAAIDPNTGDVYVAWREFRSSKQPDAILSVRSTDGGASFSDPVTVALINPFDQATTPTSFRTNSYPTMAADASGRVYVAWAQRGIGPGGDARAVVSTSTNGGRRWSPPVPADNFPARGHQIMPVLSFGAGRLNLVFWDQRDDVSQKWGPFIDDLQVMTDPVPPGRTRRRHTLDLRAVAAWPGAPPTWGPSAKLSNYLEGVRPGKTALDESGTPISEQLQFNAPNLPLFSLGTKPFIGDYLDVSVSPSFIANGDGSWRYNTETSDPSMYFTAFSDNRDVRPPTDPLGDLNLNGNFWDDYTPPTFAGWTGTSLFDPTQSVQMCSPGRAGMRDQNIYSNKVATGLVMTTIGNTKPLGFVTGSDGIRRLIQRTFVITVTNPDPVVKSVVLHINSQPPGGHASFLQFDQLIDLPVNIAAKSSISREVFVTSTDTKASVPITVTEGTNTTSAGRIVINPDPTNPDIENPDIENPDIENPDIENAEAHAITVSAARVSNPDIENLSRANPDIENPDIENPDIENRTVSNLAVLNPDIENPDIENPDIENPDIENPDIENPDIENPDIENPDIENAALTDIKWDVANVGNTATVYQVKLLLKEAQRQRLMTAGVQFQLLVIKKTAAPVIGSDKCKVVEPNQNLTVVNINSLRRDNSDVFVDPTNEVQFATVVNPDIENPDIENATVALAPGDTAEVVLRVYSPVGDTTLDPSATPGDDNALEDLAGSLEDLEKVGVATTSHPVDTIAAQQGETTPVVEASVPLIVTTTLDDAARTQAYTEALEQTGATLPFSFAVVSGALPPGLALNAAGTFVGTPAASGTFAFTVRLTDANEMVASATLELRVFEPVSAAGAALPGANVSQPYSTSLSAIGGFPPYGWAFASGSLPAGVSLSPLGLLSGTPTQSGTFNFLATVTDSALPSQSAVGAFVLNVTAAASGQSVNAAEDVATPITVSGTGGGPFTFNIGNSPAHGTLTGTGPIFTYTSDLNYNGPDSFTFSVTQGALTSAFATVSINVTAVNDAPVATPKTVNTPQGIAVPIVLTGTDIEDNPLTFSIVANPASGTLSGTGANRTYTPAPGFTGTATFTFRVNDGVVFSPAATVTVIVGPPPPNSADMTLTLVDAPDPVALGGSTTHTATIQNNGPATATGVSFSLSYPEGDLLLQAALPSQGSCTTGNPIVCTIGSMVSGATVTVPVSLKAFNRGGTFNVSSSVSGTLLDYNTSNNAAAQSTVVTGPAVATTDRSVSQTRLPATVAVANNVVYTIVVTNNGPSDATGVTLVNTFTSNTALFAGSTASQGSCNAGPSQLTCAVGDLAGGSSATYTLTLTASASGSLSNTAVVSGSQSDPTAVNNTHTLATPVDNRAPAANDDAMTTKEDLAGTFTVLSNDTDLDGDALTITGVTVPTSGTAQIVGNAISYTPAGNYNGAASFDYAISDGRGGIDVGTVSVTVIGVNDAPSFVKGADVPSVENGGPQTVPNWADPASFSAGPANETAGQGLQFLLVSGSPLFSVPPAVSLDGTLTFTPGPDANGTALVTIYLKDNGGTDNGGIDTSAPQTFAITLSAVNSAPTFVIGPNQTVPEDSGLQTVPGWATFIKAGPADEAGQSVTFTATTSNDDLFSTLPAVAPNGTLTYQPAPNQFGSAQIYVSLRDNAGAPPGTDTSAQQSFYIAVTAEADPLAAINDTAVAPPATPININVVGNDTGPAMVSPGRLIAFERFAPSATAISLGFVNETARVNSTGYLYVSGTRGVAVLHPTTNAVVATIDHTALSLGGANTHQVNQAASIVYFRHGANTITAIDGNQASGTFNQRIGRLQIGGNVQSFAVDETRSLLYIAYSSSGSEVVFQARLAIVDANPANGTFHQVITDVALPLNIRGMALDPANDRVYLASDNPGLLRINAASQPARVIVSENVGGSLQDLVFSNGKVYGFGAGGRIAAYDPLTAASQSVTVPALATGFNLGRRIVAHTATNRIFVRSSGQSGATGKVVGINGNTATWPGSAVLADIPVGRDGASDLIVDQSRGLVITSSALDNRVSFIDATATPPALSGAEQSLPISGDMALDPVAGRVYFISSTKLQRMTLSPRAVLSAIHLGAENGFAVALPGPSGSPNQNRFYLGQTALGAGVRQYRTNGTPSNVAGLPSSLGRISFSAANALTNRLYFLNTNSNSTGAAQSPSSLAVVNGATGAMIANVDVGNSAFGIAVNETTNQIYTGGVVNTLLPGGLSAVDGGTHTVTPIDVSAFPFNTAFNRYLAPLCVGASCATVNKVYVQAVQPSDGLITVGVVNGATNVATPIATAIGATGVNLIRTSNALNRVFIGNQTAFGAPNDVFVVRGDTDTKVTTLVGVTSPTNALVTQSYVAVDELRGRLYLTDFDNDRLTVLNALSEAGCSVALPAPAANCYPVLASVATGDGPSTVAIDVAANRIYVGNTNDRSVTFIDGATFKVLGRLALPLQPVQLALDTSSPAITYIFAGGSVADPGAMLMTDVRGGGLLSVAPGTLTNGGNGATSVNADGTVQYTPAPAFAGLDTFTYRVTDGTAVSTNTATVSVTVKAPLAITTATLAEGQIGNVYSQAIAAVGGTPPYYWTFQGQIPGGLVPNNATGALAGTPAQSGNFALTVQVRDSALPQALTQKDYSLVVGPFEVTTTSLSNATLNQPYSATLSAGGSAAKPYSWSLDVASSPLPTGLTLSSAGVISGTATQALCATTTITVRVTDTTLPTARFATRALTLGLSGPQTITTGSLFGGVVLENLSSLGVTCGSGTRTWSLDSGTLPAGVTLSSSGSFTGQSRTHGDFPIVVRATDSTGSITKNITLRVMAKEQQGNSTTDATTVAVGGATRLAQTITVGANGRLQGIGLQNLTCPTLTPVTVDIQRLTLTGLPDGVTIAAGTAAGNYGAIPLVWPIEPGDMAIDERFAAVVSSTGPCTFNNLQSTDGYNGGDAFKNTGAGWVTLLSTNARYDLPSFRTLIEPAVPVAYLNTSRGSGTATLLTTGPHAGKVLLAGGNTGTTTAELYDPATNTAVATGSMSVARSNATATLMGDGRVLIAGGRNSANTRLQSAEIYDPTAGSFGPAIGQLSTGREHHRAVPLNDGRVLITGGQDNGNVALSSVEIYTPGAGFSSAPNMSSPRYVHSAVVLQSGQVLVSGGYSTTTSRGDLYNPVSDTFTQTTGNTLSCRGFGTSTLLNSGKVLLTGGECGGVQSSAELFDPAGGGTFAATGPMSTTRQMHSAVLLSDVGGSVLVAGGFDQVNVSNYVLPLATLERYDPTSGTFAPAGGLVTRRQNSAAVRLPSGKVLVANGGSQSWMTGNTAEVIDPLETPVLTTTSLPPGSPNVAYSTTLSAAGGTGALAITMVAGAAPALTFTPGAPGAATLAGMPATAGSFALSFQVTDSLGRFNRQTLVLTVGGVNTITTQFRLPNAALGMPYEYQLAASGAPPVDWTLLPAAAVMPPGLSLSSSGLITGTPTVQSNFNFGVRAIDANGIAATKTLSINVSSPMTITTSSVNNPLLFNSLRSISGSSSCLEASNGIGTRTWSISAGSLPPNVSLQTNGCFSGQVGGLGPFNFTVRVTDQSSPPQAPTKAFSTTISLLDDQGTGFDQGQPAVNWGNSVQIAERVITGVSGTLSGVRVNGNSVCPAGTLITAFIQGVAPNGGPDNNTVTSGSATHPYNDYITLTPPVFFAVDQQFTLVFSANAACSVRPSYGSSSNPLPSDQYPGEGYVLSGTWQRLRDADVAPYSGVGAGRYDFPFGTVVEPSAGLEFMQRSRGQHTATTLLNGKILLISDSGAAELYDPATGTFTNTGTPNVARQRHSATLLTDGTVLVTGGSQCVGSPTCTTTYWSSAEIYHATTGLFELLPATMTVARAQHTATRIANGKVLLAGGWINTGNSLQSAEFYDESSRNFTATGPMAGRRHQHTATLLNDGRVLMAGGFGSYSPPQSGELYDPNTGTFSNAASPMVVSFRARHTATQLSTGEVLIAGGSGSAGLSAEIFSPGTSAFTSAGTMSGFHVDHTATLLPDNSVLLAGGLNESAVPCCANNVPPMATLDRYAPGSGFSNAGAMLVSRYVHTASLLNTGKVLFTGTFSWSSSAGRLAEQYDPATAVSLVNGNAPSGQSGIAYAGFTPQAQGGTGGYTITLHSGNLPLGLTYSGGTVSGTPMQSGTFVVSFKVIDSASHSNIQSVAFRIDALVITTASLPTAYQGVAYNQTLVATGIGAKTWTLVSGSLPNNLVLNANGTITGTPTVSCCNFGITVRATDSAGQTVTKSFNLNAQAPLTITTTSLGDGTASSTYGGCLGWSGGTGPSYTWSLTGQVPIGMAINNNGCFESVFPVNSLRQGGTFTFMAHLTNSSVPSETDSQEFTIRIHAEDQSPSSQNSGSVTLAATRRIAQVYRSSTPYPLSGIQTFFNLTCNAGAQFTVEARPVTGQAPRPDETGALLASASVTADGSGFFNRLIRFPTPVAIPQGSHFAIVVSFVSGQCTGQNWPTSNFYQQGSAWVDDGGGWQSANSVILRQDIPFATLVLPDVNLRFSAAGHNGHASTRLNDGRVLLAGSQQYVEIYDAVANTITQSPNMPHSRFRPTATTLTNGNVLIVGGQYFTAPPTPMQVAADTSLIFNPTTGVYLPGPCILPQPGPCMPTGRYGHNATRLADGKVLITGGWNVETNGTQTTLDSAWLFDATGSSVVTLTMTGARVEHTSTLLADTRVLILGGWTGSPSPATMAEIYDPAVGPNGAFSAIAATVPSWPSQHSATRLTLPTGFEERVLIAGGAGNDPNLQGNVYLFNPDTMSFSPAGVMALPRLDHSATVLADGRVAFAGGTVNGFTGAGTSTVEVYNPVTESSTIVGDMITDRTGQAANLINVGGIDKLALSGGWGSSSLSSRTIELVDPASNSLTITTTSLPDGQSGGTYQTTTISASGGSGPGYTFSLAWGQLPAGVQLQQNGELSGSIQSSSGGIYTFAVRVIDGAVVPNEAYRSFTITVDRLVITSTSPLPDVLVGGNYSHQLQATGVGTVTWTIECCGSLPGNIALSSNGLLSGVAPPTSGTYYFTVRATDAAGQVAQQGFSISVVSPMTLVPPPQVLGITLEYYNVFVQQQNGQGPISWTLDSGSLLPGLTLNPSGFWGEISGFPKRTGQFAAVVRATDSRQPPMTATQFVSERVLAIDQRSYGFPGSNLSIHSTQSIAQTLTVRANAPIYGIRAPVTCAAGTLTVSLRNVNPDGKPGTTVLATGGFPSPVPADQKFLFGVPAFRNNHDRVAVVFESDSAVGCTLNEPSLGESYPGGALYASTGGGWGLFPGYADAQVQTLVDAPALLFSQHWHQQPQVAMAASGNVVITGDGNVVSIYDGVTRTMVDHSPTVQPRFNGTATALANGKILLAGGYNGTSATNHAELYDPQTNSSVPTGETMGYARQRHTATLLADGRVLIAGGDLDGIVMVQMGEIYDPVANTFTDAGNMITVRNYHQATLLPSGKVLITSGGSNAAQTQIYWDAELYLPDTGFTGVGLTPSTMNVRRMNHRAVALEDGRVLITGGQNFDVFEMTATMETYDETCNCFTAVTSLNTARAQHSATLMGDGRVFVAAGQSHPVNADFESTYEIVDPANGFRAHVGGNLAVARVGHQAVRLCPQGGCVTADQILLVGGGPEVASQSIEVIDPAADILPIAASGQAYSASVAPASFVATSRVLVTGSMPPGLSFNGSTGAITGTPATPGSYQFTVMSTGANGMTAYQSLAIEVVTPPSAPGPGDILISEVRAANGNPVDFVEVYNNTDFDFTVAASDASSGWALVEAGNYQLVYIPNGTLIKARSNYVVNQWYGSIGPGSGISSEPMIYAGLTPLNRPLGTQAYGYYDGHQLAAGAGVALFTSTTSANWTLATRLDAMGFATNSANFREGSGLPATGTIAVDHAWVRRQRGFVMQDTDDNDADFELVAVNAGTYGSVQAQLGSSGAEHSNAPRYANLPGAPGVRMQLLDPLVGAFSGVNMHRNPAPGGALQDEGYVEFRRTIVNQTGQPITRLRLRVADITAATGVGGEADLRLLTSPGGGHTLSDGTPVSVVGATLDQPPAQNMGGGRNSSLSIAIPGGTLQPGASVHVAFRLGVVETGNFRFVLDVPMPGDRGVIP